MASELYWRAETTGGTYYATIRSSVRTMWNGSALEALTVANWGNYDITLAETPASSYFYVGDWPAALTTVGFYWVDVYLQAGASPAISDTLKGTIVGYWNGTTLDPWDCDAVQTGGTANSPGDVVALIGNIATTGAAAYEAAASFTKTTGGTEVGTFANIDTSNTVYHQIPDSGGTLDVYYEYTLRPDEVGVGVVFKGRMTGNGDNAAVQAYNWLTTSWVTLFTLTGVNTSVDTTQSPALVGKYTGTGANIGKVRIRVYGTGLTSANLYVDQCVVAKASTSRTVGYSNGAVWVDSSGAAGQVSYVNGVADNPCPWADAVVVAAALSIRRFEIAPNTTVTPAADLKRYSLSGKGGWALALNSVDYSYTTIYNCEYVTGTATAVDHEMMFWESHIESVTLGEFDMHRCHVMGTVTLGAEKPYLIKDTAFVAASGTPTIDFGTAADTRKVVMANVTGICQITNMRAGNVLDVCGDLDLTLAASCTGGTVYLNGNIRLTNSGSGQTIYQDGRMSLTGINAEVDTALSDIKLDHLVAVADSDDVVDNSIVAKLASKGATADWSSYNNTTDSLEANRDNIGTAGAGLTAVTGVGSGTGAYACTWTVNDGATALQGATVSFWLNGVLQGTGTTGVAGTVSMSLDAATYTVAITLDGYVFANTTHAVSSTGTTWTKTFSMTAVAITAPTNAGTATGRLDMHAKDTTTGAYQSIYVRQTSRRSGTGHGDSKEWRELVSNALGVIESPFWKSQTYEAKRGRDGTPVAFTVGTDDTFYLPSILGEP